MNAPRWLIRLVSIGVALAAQVNLLGDAAVRLNNYTANWPIVNGVQFAFDAEWGMGKPYVEVFGGPLGGWLAPIIPANTNSSAIPFKEPGFFDAGIGMVPNVVAGGPAEFEIKIFNFGWYPEAFGDGMSLVRWTQLTGSWPLTDHSLAPPPLQIPGGFAWVLCEECRFTAVVVALVHGQGKIEIFPPPPDGENLQPFATPWPPPGPVSLHAIPEPGNRFVHWMGTMRDPNAFLGMMPRQERIAIDSPEPWLDFELKIEPAILIANFEPSWHLGVSAPFGGCVTNCPGGYDFPPDTEVQLTATAKPHFAFTHWTGDVTGTNRSIQVAMTTNLTVTAHFRAVLTPQLIVQPPASGDGIAANRFHFTLLGEVGRHYLVEFSPDLQNWSLATEITATNSVNPLDEIGFSRNARGFYRAKAGR